MNATELAAFKAIFNNEKTDSLVKALEDVLPERKSAAKTKKNRYPPVIIHKPQNLRSDAY